jgi:hypothetical protein
MNNPYLNSLLLSLLGNSELVAKWWTSPNKAFAGLCPEQANEEAVREYLEGHCFK